MKTLANSRNMIASRRLILIPQYAIGKNIGCKTKRTNIILDDAKADSGLVHAFGSVVNVKGAESTILIMPPAFLQIGRCPTKLGLKALEAVDIQDPFFSFREIKMVQPP